MTRLDRNDTAIVNAGGIEALVKLLSIDHDPRMTSESGDHDPRAAAAGALTSLARVDECKKKIARCISNNVYPFVTFRDLVERARYGLEKHRPPLSPLFPQLPAFHS